MGERTSIAWAHATFNPWMGCTKVGPGCDHCYAERDMDHRRRLVTWGAGQPRRRTGAETWRMPWRLDMKARREQSRKRVFCASLADVFDNEAPDEWRRELWDVIEGTPNLDWLLLTKRIGNARRMLPSSIERLPNVWLGATVVTQEEADRDIPRLLEFKAVVRWLSIEPMLEPITLGEYARALEWVVVGGESGAHARRLEEAWALAIREECAVNDTAFFMKQGSEAHWPDFKQFGAFPPALQVRQFPRTSRRCFQAAECILDRDHSGECELEAYT